MTKQNLIDLIIHRLAGGDLVPEQIGKFHPGVVEKFVDTIYSAILYSIYRSNDSSLDLYTKQYSVAVSTDTVVNRNYITLPAPVVELPDNKGIRMITAKQDHSFSIPVVSQQFLAAFNGMDIRFMHEDPFAWSVGNRIYFHNLDADMTSLYLTIVVPFSTYADSDVINIPSSKGMDLVDMVFQAMIKVPEEDVANDNNTKR